MKLNELKKWIDTLPEDFLEYDLVNGEEGYLDGELRYRLDKPITTLLVDEDTKEIALLNEISNEIGESDKKTE